MAGLGGTQPRCCPGPGPAKTSAAGGSRRAPFVRACLDGPGLQVEGDGLQHALAQPVARLQRGVQLAQPAVDLQTQGSRRQRDAQLHGAESD